MARTDADAVARVARLERLLQAVERLPHDSAREVAVEAIQALLDVYGEAFSTVMQLLEPQVAHKLAEDRLVSHLLIVHGLHPIPLEYRVRTALDSVRPYLERHGGNVELLRIDASVAHVRLHGTCNGCSASETTLKGLIERAVQEAAPELDGVEAESVSNGTGSFVALECLVP